MASRDVRRLTTSIGADWRQLLLAIAVFAGIAAAAIAPGVLTYPPARDSGVFLYAGQRVLQGDIPYRDFWDHKGPLIYYIDALGLFIGGGSISGVWAIEFITLVLAGILGYSVMRTTLGKAPAWISSVLWMMSLAFVLGKGNFTEEYALPLQFLILVLFQRAIRAPRSMGSLFGLGLAAGASFLLRPTAVAVTAAVACYLIVGALRERRLVEGLRRVAVIIVGASLIIGLAAAFLAWHSALDEAVDAVIRYNAIYASRALQERVDAVSDGLFLLSPSGIGFPALAAFSVVALHLLIPRKEDAPPPLVVVSALALPLEFLLTAIAGRSYDHYYMAWLPSMAVLSGYFLNRVLPQASEDGTSSGRVRTAWVVGILAACAVLPIRRLGPQVARVIEGSRDPTPLMVGVVERWMEEDGYLLMWGAESSYNFIIGAPSPSRFVYLWPLYTCGYTTTTMAEEFRDRVMSLRPLIVDASYTNARVPPIDRARREEWLETADPCLSLEPLNEVFAFIDTNYEMIEDLAFDFTRWYVYRPTQSGDGGP